MYCATKDPLTLQDLETEYARVPLKRSEPNVNYRETVRVESRVTALSKSQNRLNRLWASAQPLSDALVEAIESERIGPLDDPQARTRLLTNVYGWDVNHARKLWAFGPGESGANFLVDRTQSVQLMSEVKQSVVTAFKWTTSEGVLVEEPMRGVRLNILDATVRGVHCSHVPYGLSLLTTGEDSWNQFYAWHGTIHFYGPPCCLRCKPLGGAHSTGTSLLG